MFKLLLEINKPVRVTSTKKKALFAFNTVSAIAIFARLCNISACFLSGFEQGVKKFLIFGIVFFGKLKQIFKHFTSGFV